MTKPTDTQNGNGVLAKAIAGVSAVVAVVGVLAALLAPIYSTLESDREERKLLRTTLEKFIEKRHDDDIVAAKMGGHEEEKIARLQQDVISLEIGQLEQRDVSLKNSAGITNLASIFGNKLTEIETQFNWLRNIMNMRDRNGNFNDSIFWQEIFKHPMPQPTMPDAGPGAAGENANANGLLNGH